MGKAFFKKSYLNHNAELTFIIENIGNKKTYDSREIFTPQQGTIYLCSEGVFKLKMRKSKLRYNYVAAPFIYSNNLYNVEDEVYFVCASDQAKIYYINEDVFFDAVANRAKINNLIEFYHSLKIDRSHIEVIHKPSFLRLKTAIEELSFIQQELNSPIPMIPFLIERTTISRSMVYNFISLLKSGGYISTNNGTLIKITKKTPEKY